MSLLIPIISFFSLFLPGTDNIFIPEFFQILVTMLVVCKIPTWDFPGKTLEKAPTCVSVVKHFAITVTANSYQLAEMAAM